MCEQSSDIWPIVIAWGQGQPPNDTQMHQLKNWLQTSAQTEIWQLQASQLEAALIQRGELLQKFAQQQAEAANESAHSWTDWLVPLWKLWLPLAIRIDAAQRAQAKPFIQGILGGQGTGKSTLSKRLQQLLSCLNQRAVVLSIDDLYLTYAERCELKEKDKRLVWRGPPGTHDIPLGIETLSSVQAQAQTVHFPRFDKSLHQGQGDRTMPFIASAPTVVLFEGWMVGTRPLSAVALTSKTFNFPPPITTSADRQFAIDCNHKLHEYLPLWNFLDDLIVLYPQDYRWSQVWRQEAELKMIAHGKSGLSNADIAEFVRYFWKALHPDLFITPLTSERIHYTMNYKTSLVVNICRNHQIGELCLP